MGWDKYTDWDAGKDKKYVPIPKEEADKIRETIRKNQQKFKASNRQPLMISHGKYFNEYGQIIKNPAFGIDRGGNPVHLEHMEQTPEERIRNEELHKHHYHREQLLSKGRNKLSTPHWDKKNSINKYLENDKKLIEKFGWGTKKA